MELRQKFEKYFDIPTIDYCHKLCLEIDEESETQNEKNEFTISRQLNDEFLQSLKAGNINDDMKVKMFEKLSSVVKKHENVMTHVEYCQSVRKTNKEQRELILEAIHKISLEHSFPLQIFLSGPAGSGKTFLMKLLMETYNRFSQKHDSIYNSYVACASTGLAAAGLNDTTVYSTFGLKSGRNAYISVESINAMRNALKNVGILFVDEVSMIGSKLLLDLNTRLQSIFYNFDEMFGGKNIIFCGDLRQLPPVRQTPIYKRKNVSDEIVWQNLDYYPLTTVMRQKDVTFSSLLTKIGD